MRLVRLGLHRKRVQRERNQSIDGISFLLFALFISVDHLSVQRRVLCVALAFPFSHSSSPLALSLYCCVVGVCTLCCLDLPQLQQSIRRSV
ncbi:hypothetical protein BC939DRAFT_442216 [Gamsiella multidivaricata]|uniref:uncharacterized protein n=1 Tax=Gamsiella multidivaricata TaxID=101098 RepID=UPI002220CDA6|nr:uncharacterized protein BC939DRAFT_442216 [Gamsiella multidivaricata]KAI7828896.1 hypothetical protein BC939DRAFT_442216 [Gamsiella multidivaricata]